MNDETRTIISAVVVSVAAVYAVKGIANAVNVIKRQSAIKKAAKNA